MSAKQRHPQLPCHAEAAPGGRSISVGRILRFAQNDRTQFRACARPFCALLFAVMFSSAALAHETDQYSVPIGREFADLRFLFSEDVFDALQSAVTKTNARIEASLRDGQPTHATKRLQSPKTIAAAVYAQFPPVINHVETLEMRLAGPDVRRRYAGLIVRYHPSVWIYSHWALMLDFTKPARWMRCATILIDGTYLGTDKFVHFIHMGYIYFSIYQNAVERGASEQEAIAEALDVGAGAHPLSESGVLGVLSTGVFSNADLAADYCGLKFFRNLTEPVGLRGEVRPPMVVRDGELWRLNGHVRRDADFFSVFVSPHWDEVLNPSVYHLGIGAFVAEEVGKRCDDVRHWYRDETGRSRTREQFDAIARDLTAYYGEDYAHQGDLAGMVTIAGVCFQDGDPSSSDKLSSQARLSLTSHPAPVEGQDHLRRTSLWRAARGGRTEEVRSLSGSAGALEGADVDGERPLHAAARAGHAAVVDVLAAGAADIEAAAIHGQTALHLAARAGREEVVRSLLQRGANANRRDAFGCTPLHDAAGQGSSAVVALLLEAGADANSADNHGSTPLHRAARVGFLDIASHFLARGADPRRENSAGHTPIDEAKFSKNRRMIELLRQHGGRSRPSRR